MIWATCNATHDATRLRTTDAIQTSVTAEATPISSSPKRPTTTNGGVLRARPPPWALLPPKRPSGFPSHPEERHWKLPSTNPTTLTTSARRTSDVPKQSSCSNARRKQPRSTRPRRGHRVSQTRSPEAPRTGQGLSSHGRGPVRHDVPRSRRRGCDPRGRAVIRRHGGRATRARPLHVYESREHSRYRKQSST